MVTQSTVTSHCQEGDIILRVNDTDCINCPSKPSEIMASGAAGMVKAVEKMLNREKGSRTVRFLRLMDFVSTNSKVNQIRQLTSVELDLLLNTRTDTGGGGDVGTGGSGSEIDQYVVDNNKGSKSIRNSISRMDSLTLSLSLMLSPSRKFADAEALNDK